jgi:uncharacterized membrane protein
MNVMYVLTVISKLTTLLVVTSFICLLIGVFMYCLNIPESEDDTQEKREYRSSLRRKAKKLLITGFISALLCCFVPSTEEMYAIYGIGGVIDYVKGNEKAKKLPDEVIDALDKYLDEQKGGER